MQRGKKGYTYILFNKRNGTLYTGVTSDLIKRVYEHKEKNADGFTKKYDIDKLGYYEIHETMTLAIEREKKIKDGSRKSKIKLIETMNPDWKDLYENIVK
jgi:putative endonuclease